MNHETSTIPPNARDVSMSMAQVNILAIPVALVPVLFFGGLFVLVNGWGAVPHAVGLFRKPVILLLLLAGGIVLHELLHGAAWAFYGKKPLTAITFGIHWATATPFAHCTEPLRVDAYRIGALVPAILLGIGPTLLAIFAGVHWLLFPGLIFTAAAAGDFLVVWMLRSAHSAQMVQDHPDRAGCFLFDHDTSEESSE
jgi:hypothetical protein